MFVSDSKLFSDLRNVYQTDRWEDFKMTLGFEPGTFRKIFHIKIPLITGIVLWQDIFESVDSSKWPIIFSSNNPNFQGSESGYFFCENDKGFSIKPANVSHTCDIGRAIFEHLIISI